MKIIECPREMFQSNDSFITTEMKSKYINTLIRCGFDTIDIGSFVSPKAVPQMKDIKEVVKRIYKENSETKILAITGNKRGAEDMCEFDEIDYIGFPFSISETFLKRNINSDIEKSIGRLEDIIDVSLVSNKKIVVYISMAFGNPYGDEWDIELLLDYVDIISEMGIDIISISDTIGISTPEIIKNVFEDCKSEFGGIEFGLHLHTQPNNWYKKIESAYDAGVRRFDGVLGGYGGCPMTGKELIKNINTQNIIDFCYDKDIVTKINKEWIDKSIELCNEMNNI